MTILYVGDLWYGSTALQRLHALETFIPKIVIIDSSMEDHKPIASLLNRVTYRISNSYLDINGVNKKILDEINLNNINVLWIDKGNVIKYETIRKIRTNYPGIFIIYYSADDMMNKGNQTKAFEKIVTDIDLFVTTKSHNVKELELFGVKNILYSKKGFDPLIHNKYTLTEAERTNLIADVSFAGHLEQDRLNYILHVCSKELPVKVYTSQWSKYKNTRNLTVDPSYHKGVEYAKIFNASKINLNFLCKANRDKHTARSIEIPASGGFMLAERSDEHLELFAEGIEAEYFSSQDELVDKIKFYLLNSKKREEIALNGYNKCRNANYSYRDRMQEIINNISKATNQKIKNELN